MREHTRLIGSGDYILTCLYIHTLPPCHAFTFSHHPPCCPYCSPQKLKEDSDRFFQKLQGSPIWRGRKGDTKAHVYLDTPDLPFEKYEGRIPQKSVRKAFYIAGFVASWHLRNFENTVDCWEIQPMSPSGLQGAIKWRSKPVWRADIWEILRIQLTFEKFNIWVPVSGEVRSGHDRNLCGELTFEKFHQAVVPSVRGRTEKSKILKSQRATQLTVLVALATHCVECIYIQFSFEKVHPIDFVHFFWSFRPTVCCWWDSRASIQSS